MAPLMLVKSTWAKCGLAKRASQSLISPSMVGRSALSIWAMIDAEGAGAVTVMVKVVCTVPPWLSSAVIVMVALPTDTGVTVRVLPVILAVAAEIFELVTLYESGSASGSVKTTGTCVRSRVKGLATASRLWLGMGLLTTGGLLPLAPPLIVRVRLRAASSNLSWVVELAPTAISLTRTVAPVEVVKPGAIVSVKVSRGLSPSMGVETAMAAPSIRLLAGKSGPMALREACAARLVLARSKADGGSTSRVTLTCLTPTRPEPFNPTDTCWPAPMLLRMLGVVKPSVAPALVKGPGPEPSGEGITMPLMCWPKLSP